MPTKSTLVAGAAGLLVGGALLGPPLAVAQDDGGDGPGGLERPEVGRRGPLRHHVGHVALDTAAEVIGIDVDELHDALRDDQSIAQVAEANGVDPQTVVDSLVVEAAIRIDEAVAEGHLDAEDAEEIKADLPERIAELVDREGFLPGPFGIGAVPGGSMGDGPFVAHHGPGPFGFGSLDAAAEAIGVEADELHEALRDGRTVAEVAQEHGVTVEAVVDAMLADVEERLTELVTEGWG